MEFGTRLKLLSRLAASWTPDARAALEQEFASATHNLASESDYDRLEEALSVTETIGYRFSSRTVTAVDSFARSIEQRTLTFTEPDSLVVQLTSPYRNAAALLVKAIEVLVPIRYLEPAPILRILLDLKRHQTERVSRKAHDALRELAEYDIHVFYGAGEHRGVEASPQRAILDELEKLPHDQVTRDFATVVELLTYLVSPSMQGSSWSSTAVTLSRAETPGLPTVADVRARSIAQLTELYYRASSVSERLHTVEALTNATRTERAGRDENSRAMFVRDAKSVLAFFAQAVEGAELPVVQKIEHNTYWIFFHAISGEVETAALAVKGAIAKRADYEVYRTLIGFEGIFGDWHELKANRARDPDGSDERRKQLAAEYVESVTEANFEEWRVRILLYARTQSEDLATFPVFYHFLENLARSRPKLALRLLSENAAALERFLIPILRGIWVGPERAAARSIVEGWVRDGLYLYPSAKQFLSNADVDVDLLQTILGRAAEIDERNTIAEIVEVAVSNYSGPARKTLIDRLFLPAIDRLTEKFDARWVYNIWYRRELTDLLRDLDESGTALVLANLENVLRVEHHVEEVLYLIAERAPDKVLALFRRRLAMEAAKTAPAEEFDAVPFQFYKLQEPLAKAPALAVKLIRDSYEQDPSLFQYRGAHLLKSIFPEFSGEFENQLLTLVRGGNKGDIEFVVAILRNYEGETFIHNVCKEIVRQSADDAAIQNEVAIALETTGVVTGEYGMAEAYERKKGEIASWLSDPDERIRTFAEKYVASLDKMIVAERARAREDIALRKHRFGEE